MLGFKYRNDTAQFELQFIIPSENEQLVRYTLSREMVKSVLLQHFYDQDPDAGDHLYVIPTSLSMEGEIKSELRFKNWEIIKTGQKWCS